MYSSSYRTNLRSAGSSNYRASGFRSRGYRQRYRRSACAASPITHVSYSDPSTLRDKEAESVIKVKKVDLNAVLNSKEHHTNKYELASEFTWDSVRRRPVQQQLIVRRGQYFTIDVTFDRAFDVKNNDIKLMIQAGDHPSPSDGTQVHILVSEEDEEGEWGAALVSCDGTKATFKIFTPPTCYIARWKLKIITVVKVADDTKYYQYEHPEPIYMLFNPWCKDDAVYMPDEVERDEYVLNDTGYVYRGTKKQISNKAWNFGQFEDFMLDCVFYLLDKSGLSWKQRGCPTKIARQLSAAVNSSDDNGVLVGNWSGDYTGGTSPMYWAGSVKILQQYYKTKEPVSFGQCWVFSGVTTSVARCIGLPARSVTNFASAHDCDGSITIDKHWTCDGEPLEGLSDDSVWNFHVWNDVWMARPDLPAGYGGWQAIDSTPQEQSDGVFCAGPASLQAIKNGETHLLYDAPFIFAEVNADRVHWIQRPDGSYATNKQLNSIGKFLSTKRVNSDEREDVTNMYKHEEGSARERAAVYHAVKMMGTRQDIYEVTCEDIEFALIERDFAVVGNPFTAVCQITNTGSKTKVVDLSLSADIVFYTGVCADRIKQQTFSVECPPNQCKEVTLVVDDSEYVDKLVDMCNIKVNCMARVEETKQFFCDSDDFRLIKPDLDVKVPEKVHVGQKYSVELSFKNPLKKVTLTECSVSIEGASLLTPMDLPQNDVKPLEGVKISAKITAKLAGQRKIIAIFNSKELSDIHGCATVTVVE